MRGSALTRAKSLVRLCLERLPAAAYFNVVSFGARESCLFNDSVKASEENVKSALTFVDELDAPADGASDVYRVLESVHETGPVADGHHKQVRSQTI